MSYHETIVWGNLGQDPELKYLQSGEAVCNFSVAVSEKWGSGDDKKEQTTWYRVAVWGKQGENCNEYLKKGQNVLVIGRVKARAYTDKSGQPAASLELTASTVRFGSKSENGSAGNGKSNDYAPPADADQIPF